MIRKTFSPFSDREKVFELSQKYVHTSTINGRRYVLKCSLVCKFAETEVEQEATEAPGCPSGDPDAPKSKLHGNGKDVAQADANDPQDGKGDNGRIGSISHSAEGKGQGIGHGRQKDQRRNAP